MSRLSIGSLFHAQRPRENGCSSSATIAKKPRRYGLTVRISRSLLDACAAVRDFFCFPRHGGTKWRTGLNASDLFAIFSVAPQLAVAGPTAVLPLTWRRLGRTDWPKQISGVRPSSFLARGYLILAPVPVRPYCYRHAYYCRFHVTAGRTLRRRITYSLAHCWHHP